MPSLLEGTSGQYDYRDTKERGLDLYIEHEGNIPFLVSEKTDRDIMVAVDGCHNLFLLDIDSQFIFSWYMNHRKWEDANRLASKTSAALDVHQNKDNKATNSLVDPGSVVAKWKWINENFETLKSDFVYVKTGEKI